MLSLVLIVKIGRLLHVLGNAAVRLLLVRRRVLLMGRKTVLAKLVLLMTTSAVALIGTTEV